MGKDSSVGATQGEGTWGRQAGWLGAPLPPAYPENRSWGPGPLEKAVDPGSRGGGEESGASLGDVSLYGELLLRMGVLGVLYPGSSATLSGGLASLSFGSLVVGVGGGIHPGPEAAGRGSPAQPHPGPPGSQPLSHRPWQVMSSWGRS